MALANELSSDKSQVSRVLRTLAESGFVERDDVTSRYRLGTRFLAMATRTADSRLLRAGENTLVRLVEEVGERAHLSVLQGAEVLTLITQSPAHAVQTAGWVGRLVPVTCTSSGRALLFDHDRRDLDRLLASITWPGTGSNAPRNVEELYRRILDARAAGYALNDEESDPGLVAAAAPIRDLHGRIVAALNVSAPKFRMGYDLIVVGEAVSRAARELSVQLGFAEVTGEVRLPATTDLESTVAG